MLSAVLTLGACAYSVESSSQDITFLTPNAQNAKCYVYVNKLKYQVFPPETLNIKKSSKDMEISCYAPGNREIKMIVPAKMSKRAIWGGPAGMAWDYASQSLYYYPSVIAIDFSHEELKPNALPSYNNSDIKQPEEYDLEEFRPSQPRMNYDKHKIDIPILRRGESIESVYSEEVEENQSSGGKSDLQSVLDNITKDDASDANSQSQSSQNNANIGKPVQIIYAGE